MHQLNAIERGPDIVLKMMISHSYVNLPQIYLIFEIYPYIYIYNVNPGLTNHSLLIRGGTPPIVIIQHLNGTPQLNSLGVY